MNLNTLIDKLKPLKALPFVKDTIVEEVIEAVYKSVNFIYNNIDAHTSRISKLERNIEH